LLISRFQLVSAVERNAQSRTRLLLHLTAQRALLLDSRNLEKLSIEDAKRKHGATREEDKEAVEGRTVRHLMQQVNVGGRVEEATERHCDQTEDAR